MSPPLGHVSQSLSANSNAGDSVGLAIWQMIESNITILCVSLVASKPVVMFLLPDGFISRMGSDQRQLLPREAKKSKGMQNLPSQAGSDAGSYRLAEDPIELRKPPGSLSKGSHKLSQHQKGLDPYVESPTKFSQPGV